MPKRKTKSPLKAKPLRVPGQSLDDAIRKLVDDRWTQYFIVVAAMGVVTLLEWYRWWKATPPAPLLYTSIFLLCLIAFLYVSRRMRKRVKHLKQGRDGERAVGQELEKLRTEGAIVFHDIVEDGFNIDHVVLSERGVFAIETKTISKPQRGKAIVELKDDLVRINGRVPDRDPIIQAKAAARTISQLLKEGTGMDYPVQPVVLYPGWYIEGKQSQDYWVLEPKALPSFVRNGRIEMDSRKLTLGAYHLSRYIRNTNM